VDFSSLTEGAQVALRRDSAFLFSSRSPSGRETGALTALLAHAPLTASRRSTGNAEQKKSARVGADLD